jgi:hypothetical protein
MYPTKLVFSLQDLHHGWWQAVLSDGTQQATIRASYITGAPLLLLLWAVRLLLLGANESKCIWLVEPGQYRWLFVCTEKQVQIHIVWFDDTSDWSDEKGETVLRMECNLLAFAKRFSHQLGQLEHQGDDPGVSPQEYQKLKEAIMIFEHARPDKQT